MDLSRISVCFFVLVGVFLLGKVLPCGSGKRIRRSKCGDSVSSKESCPKTCCFDTTKTPSCYFQENAYGPIRHSNGLCINVKGGSHKNDTPLIWSRDCTSRNAFFLVSYDHPPFHVASGKCVLLNGSLSNPGDSGLALTSNRDCNADTVTYRPTKNGNLEYYYALDGYKICIGSKSDGGPKENDHVSISEKACERDKTNCQDALSYVYQRKFTEGKNATFNYERCSTIEVILANYGVQILRRYPFAIFSSDENCVTTTATSVMRNKCNGKTQCSFVVSKTAFLQLNSLNDTILLVRYTCKEKIPAAPYMLNITVKSQNELFVVWSNNNNNGVQVLLEICWTKVGDTIERCHSRRFSNPTPNIALSRLQPATTYNVTVAQYSSDEKTLGIKRHKIAITRSAALNKVRGTKSATSFEIQLGTLQADDIYVQIVVSKLQNNRKPPDHPGNDLQPYDENTVNNKPYITAELVRTYVIQNSQFIVGDDNIYIRSGKRKRRNIEFKNVKLQPETYYSVFQRTFKSADLYYDSDWMNVIKTDSLPPSQKQPSTPLRTTTVSGGGGDPLDEKQDDDNNDRACRACNKSDGGTEWYLYIVSFVSGIIVGVVLLCIVVFCCRRLRNSKPAKALQSNPEPQKPEDNSVYESLDLTAMNSGDDNYQSLQGNSVRNEVSYENADSTYIELNTIREEENNYENLK